MYDTVYSEPLNNASRLWWQTDAVPVSYLSIASADYKLFEHHNLLKNPRRSFRSHKTLP